LEVNFQLLDSVNLTLEVPIANVDPGWSAEPLWEQEADVKKQTVTNVYPLAERTLTQSSIIVFDLQRHCKGRAICFR
jgi:hypothetical protein